MAITKGTDLTEEIYGGVIDDDSAGFYTSMEFFGILSGTLQAGGELLPPAGDVKTKLLGADFARRYAWPPEEPKNRQLRLEGSDIFTGELANPESSKHKTLQGLVRALAAPRRSNATGQRTWNGSHLMPYSKHLAHWDIAARGPERNAQENDHIEMERYYLRGAGALVHKIIRMDNDKDRLKDIRTSLTHLLNDIMVTDRLFEIFNSKDISGSEQASIDSVEKRSRSQNSTGEKVMRKAIHNLLSHKVDKFIKVDSLMHILPLAVLCLIVRKSQPENGDAPHLFVSSVVDCGNKPSQLRRESKRSFATAHKQIEIALRTEGEKLLEDRETDTKQKIIKAAVSGVKGYYPRSAASIGFLNAPSGVRHHVLKDPLINALVMAEIPSEEEEITLDDFCSRLFRNWGMVVNRNAAERAGLLKEMNGAVFDRNMDEDFASSLRRLGVLKEFSDQTKIVGLAK